MESRQSKLTRAADEAELLRFLCDPSIDMAQRTKLAVILEGYSWDAVDHTILFECIRDLLARKSKTILEHLPSALTRRGFPDIPCDALSAPAGLNADAALALAEKLARASQ